MIKKDFLNILNQESGMAIIMVTSAVALMTLLLSQFTFDTKLNSIKIYNYQDKAQAKLNAEAGIKFALAKLKIYQAGHNKLEENENLKKTISPSLIQDILTQPFVYPIPLPKTANIIQKNAVTEFEDNNLIRGQLTVVIKPVSGFLNPNNLRVPSKKDEDNKQNDQEDDKDEEGKELSPQEYIEKELIKTLEKVLEEKREEDDEFSTLYSNIKPDLMVKELKYFVNPKDSLKDPEVADFELMYSEKNVVPKHAPLTSLDELYLLAGWDDTLVNLIKDRLSVNEVSVIPINEITLSQLKVIFPDIDKIQSEEFFKHRDGDLELDIQPQPFQSAEDFKQLIVQKLGVLNEKSYDEKVKQFESAGLRIAVAGKLFQVTSIGSFGRSEYKLTAITDLPVLPSPEEEKKDKNGEQQDDPFAFNSDLDDDKNKDDKDKDPSQDTEQDDSDEKKEEKKPVLLMEPRVISIR